MNSLSVSLTPQHFTKNQSADVCKVSCEQSSQAVLMASPPQFRAEASGLLLLLLPVSSSLLGTSCSSTSLVLMGLWLLLPSRVRSLPPSSCSFCLSQRCLQLSLPLLSEPPSSHFLPFLPLGWEPLREVLSVSAVCTPSKGLAHSRWLIHICSVSFACPLLYTHIPSHPC